MTTPDINANEKVSQLYIALFNRAPESSGFNYWVQRMNNGDSFAFIAQEMFNCEAARATYPKSFTSTQIINTFYANVLGRTPDTEGLTYWKARLDEKGANPGVVITSMIDAINGYKDGDNKDADINTAALNSQKLLNNKLAVSLNYAQTLSGDNVADATSILSLVTATDTTKANKSALEKTDPTHYTPHTTVLTKGIDSGDAFVGKGSDDTYIGNDANGVVTLTSLDAIDGKGGDNSLNISATQDIDTTKAIGISIQHIQTANLVSTGTVTTDTTAWLDLTNLNTTSIGGASLTAAAATTAILEKEVSLGANAINVNGGNGVNVSVAGATTGTINIGANTAAKGAVVVAELVNIASGGTAGKINVNGGSTVNITETAKVDTTLVGTSTQSAITVTGSADTTAVTVKQSAAYAASGAIKNALLNGAVTITDTNTASSTAAGTITSVSLENFGAATVNSGALSNIKLSGTAGSFKQTNGSLTTPTALTDTLILSSVTSTGAVDLGSVPTTLNIVSTTGINTLNSLSASGATSVNISGDKALVLTGETFSAKASISSTSSDAVTLGSALAIDQKYTGGSGADTITLTAGGTKAITTGDGNDVVTYAGAFGTGGSLDVGAGTDTIKMTAALGAVATIDNAFTTKVTNFDVLEITDTTAGAKVLNMMYAAGAKSVILDAGVSGGAYAITNVSAGFTLTQKAANVEALSISLANDTGTNDTVNLAFAANEGFKNLKAINVANVENLLISTKDTDTTAQTSQFSVNIADAAAKTITVSGDTGVALTLDSTALTNVDASGLTGKGSAGGFSYTSGALAAASTIKGSAAGTNAIDFSASAGVVTYIGGTGSDIITSGKGMNVITGGGGEDTFIFKASSNGNITTTITDANKGDTLTFLEKGVETFTKAKIALAGTAVYQDYLNQAAADDGSTNGHIAWFQYGGDTYVVEDNSASASFVNGTDIVVKLSGLVDLSGATGDGTHAITLA